MTALAAHLPWLADRPTGALAVPDGGDVAERLSALRPTSGLGRLLLSGDAQALTAELLSGLAALERLSQAQSPLYVFGAKLNAAKMLRFCQSLGIPVAGLIDNDPAKQATPFEGLRVHALAEVPKDAFIVNASGRYALEIGAQLRAEGYQNAWNMTQFMFVHDLPFQAHAGFRAFVTDMVDRQAAYLDLYLRLADAPSRRALDAVIDFRLTLSETALEGAISPYDEEFFDQALLALGPDEGFVDGGAYDGDSFARFRRLSPDHAAAYLYEPDAGLLARARESHGADPRIRYRQAGLYSENTTLYFTLTGAMDGALSTQKPAHGRFSEIPVVAIDADVDAPVSYIKLDIEGAEEAALRGAVRTIRAHHPRLAIACYHKPSDLVDLLAQVDAMGPAYDVYLRHYSQTLDDSILYLVPSQNRNA